MLVITGATGQLGRLVIEQLLEVIPAAEIVAAVRNPAKAVDLQGLGVQVRHADYSLPATLDSAFAGAEKILFISSSEIGQRQTQHQAVIDAATRAEVKLIAYTSVLHADTSLLALAEEHRQTEAALAQSGLPFAVLRNGWYSENYTAGIPAALQHGAMLGSAAQGRISSAARADYAAAAVAVLTASQSQAGRIFELAGDESYTLSEFAAELSRQAGKSIPYTDLPPADYRGALLKAGLPEFVADLLSDSDAAASKGALFDDSRQLGKLIGRPTTSLSATIAATLSN